MNLTQAKNTAIIFTVWMLSVCFPARVRAQLQYEEGVWVSYTDFNQVTDVAVGRDYIYIATKGGVLRYHRYRNRWEDPWVVVRGFEGRVDLRGATNVDYLEETNEVAVAVVRDSLYHYLYDPVARYWMRMEPGEHTFSSPLQVDITDAIFLDLPGWTVSHRTYFLQGKNVIMDSYLRKFYLGVFADDGWGNWWVGIDGIGTLQLDRRSQRGIVWEMGLYSRDVHTLARGEGWTILAGHNRQGGIVFWKREKNIWDHLEPTYTAGLESSWINDLAVYNHWVLAATDYGLAQINLKDGTCRTWTVFDGLWSKRTTCVAVDGDTAWVGMENGVCILHLPRGPVERLDMEALLNQPCYRIAVDAQAVWIGGEIGLFRLDRKTGTGGYLGLEGGVGGAVHALHSIPDEIWVGRFTGIEAVDKQSLKQTGFPAQAFFDGAEVNAIMAGDSLVWIGTNRGLWKFDRVRNRWHRYSQADGLLDNRVYSILGDGDYLLLGTRDGVTRFFWNDPTRID